MFDAYHSWYYDSKVWSKTTWLGVPARKSVQDMWNYQEIIVELQPSLIVEFGVRFGGSTLFFASILDQVGIGHVLGVDITLADVQEKVRNHPRVELMECSSTDPAVSARIAAMRGTGTVFAILDSDHRKNHVMAELSTLTPILKPGDYLIVEDSNINGHPVLPDWGEGPWEALEEFLADHPDDYVRDVEREKKFGWTFAPGGWLIRS
jgi:cephalosporin hydroxylase